MKKLKRNIKILKILIVLTVLFVIANAVLLGFKAVQAAGVNYITQSETITNPEPMNFLLVGTDLGGNRTFEVDGVRTDVQMIISLVPSNERGNAEVNVVNIPRDVATEYSCGGYGKVNGAAYQGASIAIESGEDYEQAAIDCTVGTVEQMFDINIDYYVGFNFDSFISIVDGIGGIDLINQYEFCEQDEYGQADAYCFEEGEIHLDGSQALAYARQRYSSSDYERGQRQQLIMTQVFAKIMSSPSEYIDTFALTLVNDTINNITTDLVVSLLNWSSKTFNNSMHSISNGNPMYVDIKSSSFSNDTGFSLTDSVNSQIDAMNTGDYPIYEIYDSYDTIEQSTIVTRYMLTKNGLGLPTTVNSNATESSVIELQFISAYVHEGDIGYGYYSYIDEYTASYINNQFDNNDSADEEDSEYTEEVIFSY
ncbi:LCP family protein [Mollicutes bacterium LVI A0039]|nr:LCP family protein [Mollicutes bacterium LVI A0039]